jgi:hypothetical protein
MKRTEKTLFELADVIGECLIGDNIHIISIENNDAYTAYRVYCKEDSSCFEISREIMSVGDNVYYFESIWQGNSKLTVYTANQLLEQFQK